MSHWSPLPGLPVDEQIFAIGDIHGQAATLEKTLARIADTPRNGRPSHLIFLGDLTDRGPENLRTVEMAMNAARHAAVDTVTILPGNHELMMIDAIAKPAWNMRLWAKNGGYAVLDEIDPDHKFNSVDEASFNVEKNFRSYLNLIDQAPDHLRIGDLLFVHAGINPGNDMDEFLAQPRFGATQMSEHWAWIREPFLSHEGGWGNQDGLVIVHGHTPAHEGRKLNPANAADHLDRVESNRRICLDAGAAEMGQIGLLEVSGDAYRIDIVQEVAFNPALDDEADSLWWENSPAL